MGRVSMTYPQSTRNEFSVDGVRRHIDYGSHLCLTRLIMGHPDKMVSHDDLIEHIWIGPEAQERYRLRMRYGTTGALTPPDDCAPLTAPNILRTYITRLRTCGVIIEGGRWYGGYRIPPHGRAL